MYQPTDPITTADALGALFVEMHPSQVNKVIDRIDDHLRAWIACTTFVSIASCDDRGNMDVSPKGDPAGFMKVLDEKTLVVPDRIGNQRADTFLNVLVNPRVGMMLVVPQRKEVVRINGAAEVVRDPALLDMTIVNGHRPDLALLVRVEEAFFHCGKAMIRSAMWQPEKWGSIEGLPTYAEALKDHGAMDTPLADIEARMAYNESDRLY
ncbi:MAG: MSMEG_1061 family FMN-dependent PPOX-type flavoprotein [Pseudomonadota bacterium]